MVVTQEEWEEWKQHPTTQEFFKMLTLERERVKELLVLGLYEEDEKAKGIAQGLKMLQEMTYEEFREASYGK